MPAPSFVLQLLGLRNGVPNNADIDSVSSKAIAMGILEQLGLDTTTSPKSDMGGVLEVAVENYLKTQLLSLDPERNWQVSRGRTISAFSQYQHLDALDSLAKEHPELSAELGRDYLISPDVTVGFPIASDAQPLLHAAVSCKWTIRSDRVQNIRHEGIILTRTRRGRQPHIVTVTAEPLPSRLASIARGTGEVDAVYHVAFEELIVATAGSGTAEQQSSLEEIVGQHRLFDIALLPQILAVS